MLRTLNEVMNTELSDVYIESQSHVMTETVKGELIHVVVKQTNFLITLSSNITELNDAEVVCELLYDEPTPKPVNFINQPPLKYKTLQNTKNLITVECKLNVLSSKHEDHLFKVKITVILHDKVISELLSQPIKCISKLDPYKRSVVNNYRLSNSNDITNFKSEKGPRTKKM